MMEHVRWKGKVHFKCILKFHPKAGYDVYKKRQLQPLQSETIDSHNMYVLYI